MTEHRRDDADGGVPQVDDTGGGPPPWLTALPRRLAEHPKEWFEQFAPPPDVRRRSAVLILFGPRFPSEQACTHGANIDVVLTERSATLRSHAAQVAFPGGHIDPGDDGPVGAALREANEEVGLDPASVEVIDTLPPLYLHPSGNSVTPVLAWWRAPHPIGVVDSAEVAKVVRVALDDLLDPANRFTVATLDTYRSPGFAAADDLFVWGFTAKLLDVILDLADLTRPWDDERQRPLPQPILDAYLRGRP